MNNSLALKMISIYRKRAKRPDLTTCSYLSFVTGLIASAPSMQNSDRNVGQQTLNAAWKRADSRLLLARLEIYLVTPRRFEATIAFVCSAAPYAFLRSRLSLAWESLRFSRAT